MAPRRERPFDKVVNRLKPADLLEALRSGRLSLSDAEARLDAELTKAWPVDGVEFHEYVGFSDREYTAFLQGAALEDLLWLRVHGWPLLCQLCGDQIDYGAFWWSKSPAGTQQVRHIECPVPAHAEAGRRSRAAWLTAVWLPTYLARIGVPMLDKPTLDVAFTVTLRDLADHRAAALRTAGADVLLTDEQWPTARRRLSAVLEEYDSQLALFHPYSPELGAVLLPAHSAGQALDRVLASDEQDAAEFQVASLDGNDGVVVDEGPVPGERSEITVEVVSWGALAPSRWWGGVTTNDQSRIH
jgi:hypothetical protein